MVRQLFHSVSRLCKRHVRHWRNSLKSCGKKPKKPCCLSRCAAGTDPYSSSAIWGSLPWIPERKKKSKQTEGRCEVISGNSSLIVLFWPPTPHAIQQQRRCAGKKTHARRCERMRLGLRTKCWGLMRSGGGDKERAPSVLQQGVQAKGSEQTNCCQSVGRRRGKQKKAHARTKDLRVSARLCDSVFALNVYMRIH